MARSGSRAAERLVDPLCFVEAEVDVLHSQFSLFLAIAVVLIASNQRLDVTKRPFFLFVCFTTLLLRHGVVHIFFLPLVSHFPVVNFDTLDPVLIVCVPLIGILVLLLPLDDLKFQITHLSHVRLLFLLQLNVFVSQSSQLVLETSELFVELVKLHVMCPLEVIDFGLHLARLLLQLLVLHFEGARLLLRLVTLFN